VSSSSPAMTSSTSPKTRPFMPWLGILMPAAPLCAAYRPTWATTEGNETTVQALDDDPRRPSVAVNVTSTVHLGKAVAERMVAHGDGRLLFTSSVASQMPGPLNATYVGSKSFVQSFAEAQSGSEGGRGH
jgi:NAD(P)-dependent dehydrogenase (short-subunit alcohol dehydrogenase family)